MVVCLFGEPRDGMVASVRPTRHRADEALERSTHAGE